MRLYKNMVFLTSVENLFLEDDKKAIATFLNTHNLQQYRENDRSKYVLPNIKYYAIVVFIPITNPDQSGEDLTSSVSVLIDRTDDTQFYSQNI